MNELHEAALEYHRDRLPITLCAGKRPLGKDWPHKRWTVKEIDQHYRARPALNPGTRLGPGSQLIDFDADSPEAEQAMLDLFDGNIPMTPTFRSKRGKHWLMAWHPDLERIGKTTIQLGALEIRIGANGKGCQTLMPPSVTDGTRREWVEGLHLGECDRAPLRKHVLQQFLKANSCADGTARQLAHRGRRERKTCPVSSGCSVSSVCQAVEAAIAATLPTATGHRHRLVFNFARHLKAIAPDADFQSLRPYVQQWHERALPFIATKPFEETWLDFAEGWDKVTFPAGQEPVAMIFAQAMSQSIPACAMRYEQPSLRCLVALCRELQRVAGSVPFFLAGRTAANLLGVPHTVAARWLRLLVIDKVLERAKIGSRHRASEYRYVGD